MATFSDHGQQQMHWPGRQVLVAGSSGFAMPNKALPAIEHGGNMPSSVGLLRRALHPGIVMCPSSWFCSALGEPLEGWGSGKPIGALT